MRNEWKKNVVRIERKYILVIINDFIYYY